MGLNLVHALRLGVSPQLALVGAGGKTTALFELARGLPPPVVVTTTTHMHVDQVRLAGSHWIAQMPEDVYPLVDLVQGVTLITGPRAGDRFTGLGQDLLAWLHDFCQTRSFPLLIEADGAHCLPLKAPAQHEPAIPRFVDTVVVVAGLTGLGKPLLEEHIHRSEIFSQLGGPEKTKIITPEILTRVLNHPAGGLKNIPSMARRVALLNQADSSYLVNQADGMVGDLLSSFDVVIVSALNQSIIHSVFEPVAGIILAAGEAKRFGSPKQLLEWRGKSFIRHIVETSLAAGLSPVIVVTGANADRIKAAIQDFPVTIQHNPGWNNGQSSSIQAGLNFLPKRTGAAIFLLSDQPMVTPADLKALVNRHSLDLPPVIAPSVFGQRTNPVLFDRITFPALQLLTGDVGGRALFSSYSVTNLPLPHEGLLVDIDTPEDYTKFLQSA